MNKTQEKHKYSNSRNKDELIRVLNELNKIKEGYPDKLLQFAKLNDPEEAKNAVDFLKKFVIKFAVDISTSQIRNLYDKVRLASNETELQLLRPQITYLLARQQNPNKVKGFFITLDYLISKNILLTDFQKVFEAIVAYHKYYGKKK